MAVTGSAMIMANPMKWKYRKTLPQSDSTCILPCGNSARAYFGLGVNGWKITMARMASMRSSINMPLRWVRR